MARPKKLCLWQILQNGFAAIKEGIVLKCKCIFFSSFLMKYFSCHVCCFVWTFQEYLIFSRSTTLHSRKHASGNDVRQHGYQSCAEESICEGVRWVSPANEILHGLHENESNIPRTVASESKWDVLKPSTKRNLFFPLHLSSSCFCFGFSLSICILILHSTSSPSQKSSIFYFNGRKGFCSLISGFLMPVRVTY